MATKKKRPSERQLMDELGKSFDVWNGLIAALEESHGKLVQEWKSSKSPFGWMCLLKLKQRTLIYLTPDKETIVVAVVLGERAVVAALESKLPAKIKNLIRAARPYAEGRGIRFHIGTARDISMICDLVSLKMMPK